MNENTETRQAILEEPISQLIWKFSYPHFISYILFSINGMLDAIFVSRGVGISALAGVGIAFPILLTAMSIAGGISSGGASIVARALGENQTHKALRAISSGVFIIFIISCLAIMVAIFIPDATLHFLGANAEILTYAQDYFVIIAWGMIIHLLLLYGGTILASYGYPRHVMYANTIGISINIILNYIFIFQFGWGTEGAALATNISSLCALSYIIIIFHRAKIIQILSWKNVKPYYSICKEIIIIAFPIILFNFSSLAIVIYINRYLSFHGEILYLALINIFFRLVNSAEIPYIALSQGLYPIIGFNFGNKKYHRVIQTIKIVMMASLIISCVTTLVVFIFPGPILRLFSNDANLIATGIPLLRIIFSTWPLITLIIVGMSLFSAIGNTKVATRLSIIHQIFISITLIAILPYYFGIMGIFYQSPLVNALGGLVAGWFILTQIKEIKKLD